ncbi:hypothetical protein B0H17DRAFT_1135849 [Mycena rosella]|uniref:Uncharacterized protein n=1 Tax=Mycena rosella TaxID=1033263 RepID=A0AAD7GHB3_MYCRO|nr:hypothetical protein B0H17DRAFT_1135849 [Mycena rosella]
MTSALPPSFPPHLPAPQVYTDPEATAPWPCQPRAVSMLVDVEITFTHSTPALLLKLLSSARMSISRLRMTGVETIALHVSILAFEHDHAFGAAVFATFDTLVADARPCQFPGAWRSRPYSLNEPYPYFGYGASRRVPTLVLICKGFDTGVLTLTRNDQSASSMHIRRLALEVGRFFSVVFVLISGSAQMSHIAVHHSFAIAPRRKQLIPEPVPYLVYYLLSSPYASVLRR